MAPPLYVLLVVATVQVSLAKPHSEEDRDGTNESHAWMTNNHNSQFNVANWLQGGPSDPYLPYRPSGSLGHPYGFDRPYGGWGQVQGAGNPQWSSGQSYPVNLPQGSWGQPYVNNPQGGFGQSYTTSNPLGNTQAGIQGNAGRPITRPQETLGQVNTVNRPQGSFDQSNLRPQGGMVPYVNTPQGSSPGGSPVITGDHTSRPHGTSAQSNPTNRPQGVLGQSYATSNQHGSSPAMSGDHAARPDGTSAQSYPTNRPQGVLGQSYATSNQQGSSLGDSEGTSEDTNHAARPFAMTGQFYPPTIPQGSWDQSNMNKPQGELGQYYPVSNPQESSPAGSQVISGDRVARPGMPGQSHPTNRPQGVFGQSYVTSKPQGISPGNSHGMPGDHTARPFGMSSQYYNTNRPQGNWGDQSYMVRPEGGMESNQFQATSSLQPSSATRPQESWNIPQRGSSVSYSTKRPQMQLNQYTQPQIGLGSPMLPDSSLPTVSQHSSSPSPQIDPVPLPSQETLAQETKGTSGSNGKPQGDVPNASQEGHPAQSSWSSLPTVGLQSSTPRPQADQVPQPSQDIKSQGNENTSESNIIPQDGVMPYPPNMPQGGNPAQSFQTSVPQRS